MKPMEDTVRERLRGEADQAPDAAWLRQRVLADIAELEMAGPRRSKTLLVLVAAAAAIVAIASVTIYTASGGPSSDPRQPATHRHAGDKGACVVDRDLGSPDAWLNGKSVQNGVEAVGNILQSDYGSLDTLAGLRMGYLGTAIDGVNKRLVVVVDPSIIDVRKLQRRLTTAAGMDLIVKVAAGCHSAPDLIDARGTLVSETHNVGFELSAYDSTWHVRLSPADRDLGERLINRVGDLVVVQYVANPGGVRL